MNPLNSKSLISGSVTQKQSPYIRSALLTRLDCSTSMSFLLRSALFTGDDSLPFATRVPEPCMVHVMWSYMPLSRALKNSAGVTSESHAAPDESNKRYAFGSVPCKAKPASKHCIR